MHPPATILIRSLRHSIAALFITLAGCWGIVQAQQKTASTQEKPKIRAITAFINLDRAQYQQQVADALKVLRRAQTVLESRGYEVQTIRISTQPFPEYTKGLTKEQAVEFFKQYDALAAKEKFAAAIGPAMLNAGDSETQADLLAEILSNTKTLNASLVVAGEDGVHWTAVGAAAAKQSTTARPVNTRPRESGRTREVVSRIVIPRGCPRGHEITPTNSVVV